MYFHTPVEKYSKKVGVLRDTAGAQQPPTNPPTGHQMSRQGQAQNDQNAKFGPNLVVFGQKILILTGESKSFGTNKSEKTPRRLVCIVFWLGMGRNGPKMLTFGPK